MIFVPLGTQAMDFTRCLKMLDELIEYYKIDEEVIVQLGGASYKSKNFEVLPFVPEEQFKQNIKDARVVISHAGSGALFNAIKNGKKLIAVARLKKYHEMVNDHQMELTRKLSEGGYIIDGTNSLIDAWAKLDAFVPRGNDFNCAIGTELACYIDNFLK